MWDHSTTKDTAPQQCSVGHSTQDASLQIQTAKSKYDISSCSYESHQHFQAIGLFIAKADEHFGPITSIQQNGQAVKHIRCGMCSNSGMMIGTASWLCVKSYRYIDNHSLGISIWQFLIAGCKQSPTAVLIGAPTNSMRCTSSVWGTPNSLGGEGWPFQVWTILASNQWWNCKAHKVLQLVWWQANVHIVARSVTAQMAPQASNHHQSLHPYFKLDYIGLMWEDKQDSTINWQDKAWKVVETMVWPLF